MIRLLVEKSKRLLTVFGFHNPVLLLSEQNAYAFPDVSLVLNYQNRWSIHKAAPFVSVFSVYRGCVVFFVTYYTESAVHKLANSAGWSVNAINTVRPSTALTV